MVTVHQLKQELQKAVDYLSRDTTSYRKQTAELSLKVLESVQDVTPFSSRSSVLQVVSTVLRTYDIDRKKDVAKMLHVVYTQMNNEQNFSAEFQEKVAERKRNRGRVSMVLQNNSEQ